MVTSGGPDIVNDGLVLHLDAADRKSYSGSGTAWYDLSGNGNHGTLTNSPTFNIENKGNINFNGANSNYVTLGNKLRYQDNFTIDCIGKFPSVPNNPGSACGARHVLIYNHDYGYNLYIQSDGKLYWNVYALSNSYIMISTIDLVVGSEYFHATAIKNGVVCTLYLNSVFQSSANLSTNAVYYVNYPFVIGGFGTCGPNKFYSTGKISQVKVYNRVLSPDEIAQNYNATKGRYGL